jgi:hypothetical protein
MSSYLVFSQDNPDIELSVSEANKESKVGFAVTTGQPGPVYEMERAELILLRDWLSKQIQRLET